MFYEKIYPYILVFFQLTSLVYLLSSAPYIAFDYSGILIEVAGVFLGLISIFVMGVGNANVAPIPKKNGELITSGPYRVIRHPMYLAQLIAVLPLVIDYFTWLRLVVFVLLIITLLVKMVFEEKHLKQQFPDYAEYVAKTKKIIPFIY